MNRSRSEQPASQVLVLTKASKLLDLLHERGELTGPDIVAALQEPRSSVLRLLSSLQALGLVDPGSRRGTYRLGLRLFRMGVAVANSFDVRRQALEALEAINAEFGLTTYLTVRRDASAVCVERLEGEGLTSRAVPLGGAMPLHVGAGGLPLLAFEPRVAWLEYLRSADLGGWGPGAPVDQDDLIERLEATRVAGVARCDGDVDMGLAGVGVPVRDHAANVVAAISVDGARNEVLARADDLARVMGRWSAAVSTQLGRDDPRRSGGGH